MILIRLVIGLRSHDPITPALAQLHWLTVQLCIKFKLCLLMHQSYDTQHISLNW